MYDCVIVLSVLQVGRVCKVKIGASTLYIYWPSPAHLRGNYGGNCVPSSSHRIYPTYDCVALQILAFTGAFELSSALVLRICSFKSELDLELKQGYWVRVRS
jgi:hypothetical protein